jgi:3-oxoacyl-(acyl-carrier-protein) synthase
MTGHMIAAAGAVEVIACALAIRDSTIPVNANYKTPDPDCQLDLVVDRPRRHDVRVALSNSFGFGGSNSCVALRSPVEVDGLRGAA